MARIYIEPSRAKSAVNSSASLQKALGSMSGEVDRIRGGLRHKIAGQEQISARLKEAAEQIERETAAAKALSTGLEQILRRYEQAEDSNTGRAVAQKTAVQAAAGAAAAAGGVGAAWDQLLDWSRDVWEDLTKGRLPDPLGPFSPFIPAVLGIISGTGGTPGSSPNRAEVSIGSAEGKISGKGGIEADLKDITGLGDKTKDWMEKDSQYFYYDPKTGQKTMVDPNDKAAMEEFEKHNQGTIPVDVKLLGIGASGSIAAIDGSISNDWGFGGHEGEFSVSKLEGQAEAYISAGGAGAILGASYTALSAKEQLYLGTDDAKAYGEMEVAAGKVSGQAAISGGLIDKNGEFNPSLYAGASAEAIAGEISGKVGVDVAGVDVGLEAGVSCGVGAHANVGFVDGKFSVDVGATLGVGLNVKFDVDVSGAIDAIAGGAEAAWTGLTSIFQW